MDERPMVMGILNCTPDSFSDGGRYPDLRAAIEAGKRLVEEGADIVDVGGESTRPGAEPVSIEEELRRTIGVVGGLARADIKVSIDTMKPAVARAALTAGATIVNDVTALRDPEMRANCADAGCGVCLTHMRGAPKTMQIDPAYDDVVNEVRAFLLAAAARAEADGIARERIWIDPGIGFGKGLDHNLELLRHLDRLVETGYPLLIGVSRKSFIGKISGRDGVPLPAEERLAGTLAAQVLAQAAGVQIIRTHDVKEARWAIDVAQAILGR